jgi:hypothetical protein
MKASKPVVKKLSPPAKVKKVVKKSLAKRALGILGLI